MIGSILKERRKTKGLTLMLLSEQSGMSCSQISRIERGERQPSSHTLKRLANPLGFGEFELLQLAGHISATLLILKELETELSRVIDEELPKRDYPTSSVFSYVDGIKDGLSEARQKIRMRISIPKIEVEEKDDE